MARKEHQERWRKRAAQAVTIHLDPQLLAALDWLAIQLYEIDPHDPPTHRHGAASAGRAVALRTLLRDYAAEHPAPRTLPEAGGLSAFWIAETSWRQTLDPTTDRPRPRPPWSPALARRARVEAQALAKRPKRTKGLVSRVQPRGPNDE